jgi:iron complex outermembrane receptor protein
MHKLMRSVTKIFHVLPLSVRVVSVALIACLISAPHALRGQTNAEPTEAEIKSAAALKSMSLEQLMNIEVVSPARHEQKLSQTAAAIYVLTAEDLRRAGVTTLPDALRLAPGVQVAQVDAHTWAVSARGFNDIFANKLLVLQDGRSIYTPLFSGVYWEVQDTMFEDIDRIEVIRGPGAALWGANAVNGVINIITKKSRDTQGLLVRGGGGTEERGFGAVRYGGKLTDELHYRVFGMYYDRDDSAVPGGGDAHDSWQTGRGGFRLDWEPNEQNAMLLEGDAYAATMEQVYLTIFTPTGVVSGRGNDHVRGRYALGRWTHFFSDLSDLRLQLYYDRSERETLVFKEDRDNFDIDFQHRFALGERNNVLWGGGYRISWDNIGSNGNISFGSPKQNIQLFSAFVQDELILIPDKLRLTVGSKFEHNDFTGFEYQPDGRLLWTPADQVTFWASISRAVRTPSRAEEDIFLKQLVSPVPVPVTFAGNKDYESEKLLAYELGHRWQPHAKVSLDIALFYNDYEELRTIEPVPGNPLLFQAENRMHGETYGVEFAPAVQITDWWRVQAAYSYLQMQLHKDSGSLDFTSEADEGRSPHHQFVLRSMLDLPGRVQFDAALRYVDSLPSIGIDSYTVMDLRLGWKPIPSLDISLVARNLLDSQHPEFVPSFIRTQVTEVQHSIYGKITWQF